MEKHWNEKELWDKRGNAIIKTRVPPWTCSICGTKNVYTTCSLCGAHVDGKYESKTARVVSPNTMNRLSNAVLTRKHSKKEIEEMAKDAFKKSDEERNKEEQRKTIRARVGRIMVGIGEGTKKNKKRKQKRKQKRTQKRKQKKKKRKTS